MLKTNFQMFLDHELIPYSHMGSVGTVENHGKKWQKTRHIFVKVTKITAKSRQFIWLLIC